MGEESVEEIPEIKKDQALLPEKPLAPVVQADLLDSLIIVKAGPPPVPTTTTMAPKEETTTTVEVIEQDIEVIEEDIKLSSLDNLFEPRLTMTLEVIQNDD